MTTELAAIAGVLGISDIMQSFHGQKSSSVLQLIKGKLIDLRKLLKYFNGAATSVPSVLSLTGVLLLCLVFHSKELLVAVLLSSIL